MLIRGCLVDMCREERVMFSVGAEHGWQAGSRKGESRMENVTAETRDVFFVDSFCFGRQVFLLGYLRGAFEASFK